MIAEVSAVLAAVNAINGAINTVRETKNNVKSASDIFARVTDASVGIAEVESQSRAGKIVLSQKEAMEIALAKKKIADYDRQLKDMFLMTGNFAVYEDMKKIQADSVAAAKKGALKRAAQKQKSREQTMFILKCLFVGISVWVIAMAGLYIWLNS